MAALRAIHAEHPFYGVARLAIHLGWSEAKARRIRTLAGIVVPTASKKHRARKGCAPEISAPPNILGRYAAFKDETKPQNGMSYSDMTRSGAWAQDFTYLKFQNAWYYLAGVLDLETRQIVGWRLGANHSSELTYAAVLDALSKHHAPTILHSDQGSEYLSYKHQELCDRLEIQLSASGRGKTLAERLHGALVREFQARIWRLEPTQRHCTAARSHCPAHLLLQHQTYPHSTENEPGSLRCQPHAATAASRKTTKEFRQGVAER